MTRFRLFAVIATLGLAGLVVAAQPAGANDARRQSIAS